MGVTRCVGYLGSTMGILLSSILLVLLLIHFYHPIRTLMFHAASCTIAHSFYVIQYRCNCGGDCWALYPCLEIDAYVNHSATSGTTTVTSSPSHELKRGAHGYNSYHSILWMNEDYSGPWPVPLYIDDRQYLSVILSEEESIEQCSLMMCTSNNVVNRDFIDIFRRENVKVGMRHRCFYDPYNLRKGAFLERRISWTMAIHVVLWPCVCILASLTMFVYVCYTRNVTSGEYNVRQKYVSAQEPAHLYSLTERKVTDDHQVHVFT